MNGVEPVNPIQGRVGPLRARLLETGQYADYYVALNAATAFLWAPGMLAGAGDAANDDSFPPVGPATA